MENKMNWIRIGSGAGYGGDRIEPAIELLAHAECDYMIFECLAERTIALANLEKQKDPQKGYNHLSIQRFDAILDEYQRQPFKTKIITNMGAANPVALAKKVADMIIERGLNLKVAAIIGDDVINELNPDMVIMESGELLESFTNKVISANAYIGCKSIVTALEANADIVIGGRIADPALVLGALVYAFGWKFDEYDLLAKGTCAGHLLECAAQVCGGYFADGYRKNAPDLAKLGFPFADVSNKGDVIISKLQMSGGIVNSMTVKEQLLYEIMDPSAYLTPDVTMDISSAQVEEIEPNRVHISGVRGKKATLTYKTSVGIKGGFLVEVEISYGGHHCQERVQIAKDIISYRCKLRNLDEKNIRTDIIGLNSLFDSKIPSTIHQELRLRVAGRFEDEKSARTLAEEVESLYTNGPAGGGGVRHHITPIIQILSVLLNKDLVHEEVVIV